MTLFVIVPIIISLYSSFMEGNAYTEPVFVKLANYRKVFMDTKFWGSFGVGLKYVAIVVPSQIILAFFLASLITKLKRPLSGITKVAIYLPCILSGIVTGVIFMYIYEYNGGLLNFMLGVFGLDKQIWLGDPKLALVSVSVAAIWGGIGYVTLVMLGALLDVPQDYYEAAKIDGAGVFARTFHITLPMHPLPCRGIHQG
ncbi:hypothetical protein FACS1894130_09880 [Spirochaetia bacterium]|nr:hypothetical protein FACS1894130_09880 [Spirochaetia bacterium]